MKISVPPELIKGVKSELKDVDWLKDFNQSEQVKMLTVLAFHNKDKINKLQKINLYLWLVILLNCASTLILSFTK